MPEIWLLLGLIVNILLGLIWKYLQEVPMSPTQMSTRIPQKVGLWIPRVARGSQKSVLDHE